MPAITYLIFDTYAFKPEEKVMEMVGSSEDM
jgi:hypothetical protein